MTIARRQILIAGAGLLAGGCQQGAQNTAGHSAGTGFDRESLHTPWPDSSLRPSITGRTYVPQRHASTLASPLRPPTPNPAPSASYGGFQPIGRSQWARSGPNANINAMGGITRLTIHHEGFPEPVLFHDYRTTAERLELIRRSHRNRGWADIGYHFVVDRAGRVWEGRSLQYQGAHVSNNNSNNVGVMVLGNFDRQTPSNAQLDALQTAVRTLRRQYRISTRHIYTHQEFNPTSCPGRELQPRISSMRSNGHFT